MLRVRVTYRDKQELSVWSLHASTALQRWTVHLPGRAYEIAVSPKGDRIAWLLMPNLKGRPRNVQRGAASLWVSQLDGSRMREIGSAGTDVRQRSAPSLLMQLRWLPGGKRLSFLYNGALYTVPTD